jgi:hypothetical protein
VLIGAHSTPFDPLGIEVVGTMHQEQLETRPLTEAALHRQVATV